MSPLWILTTGRLVLRPVAPADLPDLTALKADPMVFAVMLGGVRTPTRSAEELAEDITHWGAKGYGVWSVREAAGERFVGLIGLHDRADGRGTALRVAFIPAVHGRGYASEAAGAALRFGHEQAGLPRIVGVARASNVGSRMVLGAIGMVVCEEWVRDGEPMVMLQSVRSTGVA